MKRTRLASVLLLVPLGVAACGGGSTGPSTGSASPTSASPSASASAPTATPSAATVVGYMPSSEATKALLQTKSVPGGAKQSTTWQEDYPDTATTTGYVLGELTFVRGDAACRSLLEGHSFTPGSSAGQVMASRHLNLRQMISSMQTEADAKAVMAQNRTEIRGCRTFKARFRGLTYTWRHSGGVAKDTIGGAQTIGHRLTGDLGARGRIIIWMLEARMGGELLFVNLNPTDSTGLQQMAVVSFLAAAKFADTIAGYRDTHPRTV